MLSHPLPLYTENFWAFQNIISLDFSKSPCKRRFLIKKVYGVLSPPSTLPFFSEFSFSMVRFFYGKKMIKVVAVAEVGDNFLLR